jgi:aromatic-L-amino-acid decarboxylase
MGSKGRVALRARTLGRTAPLEMAPEKFRRAGHRLIDAIADHLGEIRRLPLTPGEGPEAVRRALGLDGLPEEGMESGVLIESITALLLEHSLFNGHPRFFGYITSSAAPIGALGDLLAAAVNPNVGAWQLSPMATEIELQTVRWIAQLIGYPDCCGGVLVSGGNMANFVGVLAARRRQASWDIRSEGLVSRAPLVMYASKETHTWIQKAADLFGHGTGAIRWIRTDSDHRMDLESLVREIARDRQAGSQPFLVVGTAGSVSLGAVDPLPEIADICRRENLWFHVDGAYGAIGAALPNASADLKGLAEADSVAVDPHKWLYAPLEAGCALVRRPEDMVAAFSFHPEYYTFQGEEQTNFFEFGLQNSRGFRALKVWLGLRQAGRKGIVRQVEDDIALARTLFEQVSRQPLLEPGTCKLSIATFRFVPEDLRSTAESAQEYLNRLNQEILNRLQQGGEVFLSNAVVDERFLLRACVVNFRTTSQDMEEVPAIVVRVGKQVDAELRGEGSR